MSTLVNSGWFEIDTFRRGLYMGPTVVEDANQSMYCSKGSGIWQYARHPQGLVESHCHRHQQCTILCEREVSLWASFRQPDRAQAQKHSSSIQGDKQTGMGTRPLVSTR